MSAAFETTLPMELRGPRASTSGVLSLATVAAAAAALLVFVSGSFEAADVVGIKRPLEAILVLPVLLAAAHYWVKRHLALIDALMCYVLVKTVVEIALRGELTWILDDLATVLALTVVYSVPRTSAVAGAKFLVATATAFAVMGIVQFCWLWVDPSLDRYGLYLANDNSIANPVEHPIALLGMFTDEEYMVMGHVVHRFQSFTREPSLAVVYFLLPATLSFFLRGRAWILCGLVSLGFSILTLAGSVFLSLAFGAAWWVVLRLVPIRIAFVYGLPAALASFMWTVTHYGLQPLVQGITMVSQYGEFLSKGESLRDRVGGAVLNLNNAIATPFGAREHPDIPGPWYINSVMEGGWLCVVFLFFFLARLAKDVSTLQQRVRSGSVVNFASVLLLGVLSTVVVFNDYQMSNYAGIVLLAFIHRMIRVRNLEQDEPEREPAIVAGPTASDRA